VERQAELRRQLSALLEPRSVGLRRSSSRNVWKSSWQTVGVCENAHGATRDVRAALPPHAALVEFARVAVFDVFNAKLDALGERYLAWVIRSDASLPCCDRPWRCGSGGRARRGDLSPGDCSGLGVASGRYAIPAGLVWPEAIRNATQGVSSLVLSPDSNLWLVPYAAVPAVNQPSSHYLIEEHQIEYIVSSRFCYATRCDRSGKYPCLVLSAPEFRRMPPIATQGASATPSDADAETSLPLRKA